MMSNKKTGPIRVWLRRRGDWEKENGRTMAKMILRISRSKPYRDLWIYADNHMEVQSFADEYTIGPAPGDLFEVEL